jgi:hypothetical protein
MMYQNIVKDGLFLSEMECTLEDMLDGGVE